MTLSLVFVGFFTFASLATIFRPSDFVAFEKATTFEAHVFQPFHLPHISQTFPLLN